MIHRWFWMTLLVAALIAAGCSGSGATDKDTADTEGDGQGDTLPDVNVDDTEETQDTGECGADGDCPASDNPCLWVSCDLDSRTCVTAPAPDFALCDDDDKCTALDRCQGGECLGGPLVDCDDGDPCTEDSCHPAVDGTGCVNEPTTGPACSDGNTCTIGDHCELGACLPDEATGCGCATDADCRAYDDDDQCNGALVCVDLGEGEMGCRIDPATVIVCGNPFDPPCTETICVPDTGRCERVHLEEGEVCEDGNPCTQADTCSQGVCLGGENGCEACAEDGDCDPFDDADLCNGLVRCVAELCEIAVETVVHCDTADDTQCESTICIPGTGECHRIEKADEEACSDGNRCTIDDRCANGQCLANGDLACDDGELCTDDTCDPTIGCVISYNVAVCDDDNECTLDDACADGACAGGVARDCDDGNPCTDDTCVPDTGCVSMPNALPCEDGNPCTLNDQCTGGNCMAGTNECPCVSDDECLAYDNGNLCDGALQCVNGKCLVKPNSVIECDDSGDTQCKMNTCDPATGVCGYVFLEDGEACNDGDLCTTDDHCQGGACVPGLESYCHDGDPCTTDGCLPATGCVNMPIAGCDGCKDDEDCRDDDPCTQDMCDDVSGECGHSIVDGLPCSDGDPCTVGDSCAGGICTPGAANVCANVSCEASQIIECEERIAGDLGAEGLADAMNVYSCNQFNFVGPEQVYHFQPAVDGLITLILYGESDLYAILLEDTGDGCTSGSCLAMHTLELSYEVSAGVDYYVVVDGYAGAVEPYEVEVDCSWTDQEICDDEIDNDLDGLTDCGDPDCAAAYSCYESFCDNQHDDDDDGMVDCDDEDCFLDEACTGGWSGETCADSFLFFPDVAFDAQWIGETLVRWFSTAGATDDVTGSCNGDVSDTADIAYLFSLSEPLVVTASVSFAEDVWPALTLFTGTFCEPEFELACDTSANGMVTLERTLQPGDYTIVVDANWPGDVGTFSLSLTFGTPIFDEDDCADGLDEDSDGLTDCEDVDDCGEAAICSGSEVCLPAADLGCDASAEADLRDDVATDALSSYTCANVAEALEGYEGPELAWTHVAACDGLLTVSLSYAPDELVFLDLFVLAGDAACDGAACLAYASAIEGDDGFFAELLVPVTAGVSYDLVVDGFLGDVGAFTLTTDCLCDEVCDNELDDDDDGLTDCADEEDCLGSVACPADSEIDCFDGIDNDQDGATDCDDIFCRQQGLCPELLCADGEDDNLDGLFDCDDPSCSEAMICQNPGGCASLATLVCGEVMEADMLANDVTDAIDEYAACAPDTSYAGNEVAFRFAPPCSGAVQVTVLDQADAPMGNLDVFILSAAEGCVAASCQQVVYGGGYGAPTQGQLDVVKDEEIFLVVDGWEDYTSTFSIAVDCLCVDELCDDEIDNDEDGLTDCADGDCVGTDSCPELNCADQIDEDLDGLTDCADADCAVTPACPELECDDDLDDNTDGRTDCADPTCFTAGICTGGQVGESCADAFMLNHGFPHTAAYWLGEVEERWYDTSLAQDDLTAACAPDATGAPDVVYFMALADQMKVTATLTFDVDVAPALYLFNGVDCGEAQAVTCATATEGAATFTEILPAGDYYIVVDGAQADAAGAFALTVAYLAGADHETTCTDGVDEDADGLTDCADVDDCQGAIACQATDACIPLDALASGAAVMASLGGDDATNVIDTYTCAGTTYTDYHGPELAWSYQASCTGTVTARVTYVVDDAEASVDLFAIDGAGDCLGSACVGAGFFEAEEVDQSVLILDVVPDQALRFVVDGYAGALGSIQFELDEACD